MDAPIASILESLELEEAERRLWETVTAALATGGGGWQAERFLAALEDAARSAGLCRRQSLDEVVAAYRTGSAAMRAALSSRGDSSADDLCRHLAGVETEAVVRIASGYSQGLEETIARLRSESERSAAVERGTGALRPDATLGRLSLEVNRCQRMDLSLGLLEMSLADGPASSGAGEVSAALPRIGHCLRENLRRYDSIGRTADGAFLLMLPDISRRGLAGAAERLRREVGEAAVEGAHVLMALSHYDYVDVSAAEMLAELDAALTEARGLGESLTWS